MFGFGKKKDMKKEEVSERMIMFKMNDGTWKWLIKDFSNKIKTERDSIRKAQEMYKNLYAGAYDLYRFNLEDGEIIEIMSKFSYEEIWKMWMNCGDKIDKDGYVALGHKFKKDDEEWNKSLMILNMLSRVRKNEDGLIDISSGDSN